MGGKMSYEHLSSGGLDYLACRYGRSKLMFRGPRKKLDAPYVVMIGGSEVYGRFVEVPISEHLEQVLGRTVVNLGHLNSGLDAFVEDASVLDICSGADMVIVQVMGAQNMSNRMYAVHPRRNDRFIGASHFLQTMYRQVDFTQFHYTRHLLTALRHASRERYGLLVEELQMAWLARMRSFLRRMDGRVCLLWMSDRAPQPDAITDPLMRDPLFVSSHMLDSLRDEVEEILVVAGTPDEIEAGRLRMRYSDLEEPVAREMLGPVVHETAARALANILFEFLPERT
jgi:hypothetical protein